MAFSVKSYGGNVLDFIRVTLSLVSKSIFKRGFRASLLSKNTARAATWTLRVFTASP